VARLSAASQCILGEINPIERKYFAGSKQSRIFVSKIKKYHHVNAN
jgi:hypothetical protein